MLKVHLSQATMADFDFYFELKCGDSDIYWQGFTSKPDREGLKRCFESRIGDIDTVEVGSKIIYMIRVREEDGKDINAGYIQFTLEEDQIELGISIIETMQGKGIGKAAAKLARDIACTRCNAIYVRIREDNIASWTCFKNAGFIKSDVCEMIDYPGVGSVPFRRWNYVN